MLSPINIFISYAHKDSFYLNTLKTCLKPIEREKKINIWTDGALKPGDKWNDIIKQKLKESHIILFLVSLDFLASDYIYETEIKNVIDDKKLIIIPIIIRPIDLDNFELKCFQILPPGAKAIVNWSNPDDAWVEVIKGLNAVLDRLRGIETVKSEIRINIKKESGHNSKGNTINIADLTDKLVLLLMILLMIFGIFLLFYGLKVSSLFHIGVSFTILGFSLMAYFYMRKFIFF